MTCSYSISFGHHYLPPSIAVQNAARAIPSLRYLNLSFLPACGRRTGSTRWCEHICSNLLLNFRSLPLRIASTAVDILSYMPRAQAPPKKANALSWASKTISCFSRGYATKNGMRLWQSRKWQPLPCWRPSRQSHGSSLVAPVELAGFSPILHNEQNSTVQMHAPNRCCVHSSSALHIAAHYRNCRHSQHAADHHGYASE